MANPVIAEVTRGSRIESIHRGRVVAVDADGRVVFAAGDVEMPVYPRSALKLMQALPLVESGAADAFGLGKRELAFAGASHSSEPVHVETARTMLSKAGLTQDDLQCGAHWPLFGSDAMVKLARSGDAPTRAHNNCSGKHAGFLCTCVHQGIDTGDYLADENDVQRQVRTTIEQLTGATLDADRCGLDGCSAPTYALPLVAFARGFARLAAGNGLEAARARAARRLIEAGMAEPFMVAGTGRFCTGLMAACAGRVYVKTGAEGVYVGAIPEEGIALALKCDDGATRAAEVAIAAALIQALGPVHDLAPTIAPFAERPVHDWNGTPVGELRAVEPG
ncbi:MAG: asparaginase [Roseitalea sp.]|jgi:L-asparaginase II|nr:asparaginase [Roseitalea sp.]MBO6720487.1 asparaginase [Roseitalea sp.]MBO6743634.1 asparaginase [Roseitalea sp.]